MHVSAPFLYLKFLFIYLFLAGLRLCCCVGFFSLAVSGGYPLVEVCRLLTAVASAVAELRLQVHGLQQWQLPGSGAQVQQLWCTGLAAPQYVGSLRTRDGTHVFCIVRWIFLFTTELPGKPPLCSFSLIAIRPCMDPPGFVYPSVAGCC